MALNAPRPLLCAFLSPSRCITPLARSLMWHQNARCKSSNAGPQAPVQRQPAQPSQRTAMKNMGQNMPLPNDLGLMEGMFYFEQGGVGKKFWADEL